MQEDTKRSIVRSYNAENAGIVVQNAYRNQPSVTQEWLFNGADAETLKAKEKQSGFETALLGQRKMHTSRLSVPKGRSENATNHSPRMLNQNGTQRDQARRFFRLCLSAQIGTGAGFSRFFFTENNAVLLLVWLPTWGTVRSTRTPRYSDTV